MTIDATFPVETRLLDTGTEQLNADDLAILQAAYSATLDSEIRFKALGVSLELNKDVVTLSLKYFDRGNETVSVDFTTEPATITQVVIA